MIKKEKLTQVGPLKKYSSHRAGSDFRCVKLSDHKAPGLCVDNGHEWLVVPLESRLSCTGSRSR